MSLSTDARNALIRVIQSGVPFESRPFRSIAEDLGATEAAIIEALCELQREKILREISAVLEGSLLGHQSALATGTIPGKRIEAVAEIVSAHPTVSHNYLRNHTYNLWFTIAVPPEMPLERTLELLGIRFVVSSPNTRIIAIPKAMNRSGRRSRSRWSVIQESFTNRPVPLRDAVRRWRSRAARRARPGLCRRWQRESRHPAPRR